MKKKLKINSLKSTFFLIIILSINLCFSQTDFSDNEENSIWVKAKLQSSIPLEGADSLTFEINYLNNFFKDFNIIEFSPAFPAISKIPIKYWNGLDSVYKIKCDCNIYNLSDSIRLLLSDFYTDVEVIHTYEHLYTPNDFTIDRKSVV